MMRRVKISERNVGEQCDPFIVAEVGINHNGELDKAFQMIEIAKKVGADAVKFQTFKTEEFVGDRNQLFTYRSQGREVTEPMYDMFKRYEFSKQQWLSIKQKCEEEGILFMSTPQNTTDLELLLELGIPAIKVGSDDFTNLPLLESYSKTGLPLIVSCGMANLAEVYQALQTIGALDGYPTILLLCTSQYPTPPEDANLSKIRSLMQSFPMIPIGFSDHTQGATASTVAVGLGATFFEKHFTLDHDLPGPDHWFSENPESLEVWVRQIRTAHKLMGNPVVRPTPKEEEMKVLARRSVVAISDIRQGDSLTNANIGLRRPGNGITPQLFSKVLGRKALTDIKQGSLIDWGDFK
jgi:N,N'-diacetyllegionaminate synthase